MTIKQQVETYHRKSRAMKPAEKIIEPEVIPVYLEGEQKLVYAVEARMGRLPAM